MDPRYATVPPPPLVEKGRVGDVLDDLHRALLQRALQNVLHTEIAATTYAQIIDGLPLKNVALATAGLLWESTLNSHERLCAGALDRAIQFRRSFRTRDMELDLEPLRRYQAIPAGSSESTLPLIELVAVAIHHIAVLLYKMENFHRASGIQMDRICSSTVRGKTTFHPTPFCLYDYADPVQYPEGVAELPGYWAEDRIFGGVVLFGRGDSGTECNDLWLHPNREGVTHRICAVTDDQLADLLQFLGSETPCDENSCPLPILVDKTNRRRVDDEIAIPEHNIYRDRWERRIRFSDFEDYEFVRGGMCIIDEVDYPGGALEYFAHKDSAFQIGARNVDRPL